MNISKKNVLVMKLFTYEIFRIYLKGKFSGSKDKKIFLRCLLIASVKLFFKRAAQIYATQYSVRPLVPFSWMSSGPRPVGSPPSLGCFLFCLLNLPGSIKTMKLGEWASIFLSCYSFGIAYVILNRL